MRSSKRNHYSAKLDVTLVEHREELAGAFGYEVAWQCTVDTYKVREARETDPAKKRKLRLMLYNAEHQLRLIKEGVK